MVNIFGDSSRRAGKRGPPGSVGPAGKRGKCGENSNYYAQYFQHSKTKWDIDFKPNYWIEGYDILEKPSFKVINTLDNDDQHRYDATPPSIETTPKKGTDPVTGRHTLLLNGTQYVN